MGFLIVCMVCLTIGAISYKAASYDKGMSAFFGVLFSAIPGAMVAFLLLPAIGSHYITEYSKPLEKMKGEGYVRLIPSDGMPAFIFKPKGGYVQAISPADEDAPEVYYYQTRGTPRVEKRCGYVEDWVFPWDVTTYGGFHGCDTNLFVPAKDGILLK
jgi:hypothetical protein